MDRKSSWHWHPGALVLLLGCAEGCGSRSALITGLGSENDSGSAGPGASGGSSGSRGDGVTDGNSSSSGGGSAGGTENAFRSSWEASELQLPLVENGTYAFEVHWGDGTVSAIDSWDDEDAFHRYGDAGRYWVEIVGTIRGWSFGDTDRPVRADNGRLVEIANWGVLAFGNTERQFELCRSEGLSITATDAPDLTDTTSLRRAFADCDLGAPDLGAWHMSSINDLSEMFASSSFNGDVSRWDVSSVTDMSGMFGNSRFDGDVSNWDVSSVGDMSDMFLASPFNGDVSNWDVSSVGDMSDMFQESLFNGDVSRWDVSSVTDMSDMFGSSRFDGDVSNWDVSGVTDMNWMFGNSPFNGDVSRWDVSSVTDMSQLFTSSQFSGDVSNWDVSSVTFMPGMFDGSPFNGDVSNWDVSSVTLMSGMFRYTPFQGDVSSWNVASVVDMSEMFHGTPAMPVATYDALLVNWASQAVQLGVSFHAGTSQYSSAATARESLIDHGWVIIDGGQAP